MKIIHFRGFTQMMLSKQVKKLKTLADSEAAHERQPNQCMRVKEKNMSTLKCPVCKKPLTQEEYDKALGIWKDKEKHLQHFKEATKRFALEQKKLKQQLTAKEKESQEKLREQRRLLEESFKKRIQKDMKIAVAREVSQQKKGFLKKEAEFRKAQNKMNQLEKSLQLSMKNQQKATEEIKRLREQIEKGITPQIEGLLEEKNLLVKLQTLFPQDEFKHTGKGGDIIQFVTEQNAKIGIIVYECKKVKHYDKNHIDQAKEARKSRNADFAVLVTNAFPNKRQHYFVEKSVFVISPVSLEPIVITLRDSLVRIALLKLSNKAKEKAVQQVYDYLSGSDYSYKINDMVTQLLDLRKELEGEIVWHRRVWKKRFYSYKSMFGDIGSINSQLRQLVSNTQADKPKLAHELPKQFSSIMEIE